MLISRIIFVSPNATWISFNYITGDMRQFMSATQTRVIYLTIFSLCSPLRQPFNLQLPYLTPIQRKGDGLSFQLETIKTHEERPCRGSPNWLSQLEAICPRLHPLKSQTDNALQHWDNNEPNYQWSNWTMRPCAHNLLRTIALCNSDWVISNGLLKTSRVMRCQRSHRGKVCEED